MGRLVEPFMTYLDANGVPLANGLLQFNESGDASTAKATYSDAALTTANANPIVLDSAGRAGTEVFGSGSYRLIVKNSSGVAQETFDNLEPPVDTSQVSVLDYGAVADGSTDNTTAFQNAIDAAAGSGVLIIPQAASAYQVGELTWDYTDGELIIIAHGAKIEYTGTTDMFTATMNNSAATLATIHIYGGEWYGNSGMTDTDSLFNLIDVRSAVFTDCLFGGDIDAAVQQPARAVTLRNRYWWCERNSFFNCSFEYIQHAIVCEIHSTAGTDGGTQSFARTMVRDCLFQGGVSGECLIELIDSTSGTVGEPGLYGSNIDFSGNIADGVICMRLTGEMKGTFIGPCDVEAPSGDQAYYFKVGTLSGARAVFVGNFPDRQTDMYDPAGTATTGYLTEPQEHMGGLQSYGPTPNYNVDVLGRITAFETSKENPYMAVSGTSAGAAGLDAFGHLIIGGQSNNARDVAIVTGSTPAVRALFKGNGDIVLVPDATSTPANDGELVIEATSNTTLTFKLKGTDSTVRSGTITLS